MKLSQGWHSLNEQTTSTKEIFCATKGYKLHVTSADELNPIEDDVEEELLLLSDDVVWFTFAVSIPFLVITE